MNSSSVMPSALRTSLSTKKPARLAVIGLLGLGLSGSLAIAAPAASAEATTTVAQGRKVVAIAATKKGTPYRWGATGPRAFDCSGYTKWVYKRLGKNIPRTANQQYQASIKLGRKQARRGDLVFFGGSRKTHVGIYAGNGRMWHSPHSGSTVRLAKIYGNSYVFGRVR